MKSFLVFVLKVAVANFILAMILVCFLLGKSFFIGAIDGFANSFLLDYQKAEQRDSKNL